MPIFAQVLLYESFFYHRFLVINSKIRENSRSFYNPREGAYLKVQNNSFS